MAHPNASKTSAEPQEDEEALFPCFATFSPAPAAMIPAAVDTLNVFWPSPPNVKYGLGTCSYDIAVFTISFLLQWHSKRKHRFCHGCNGLRVPFQFL